MELEFNEIEKIDDIFQKYNIPKNVLDYFRWKTL